MTPSVTDRVSAFRRLHTDDCFVIPNPWDVGSAKYLASLGFEALATTSGGMAHSLGMADNEVPLETALSHIAAIVAATDLPVNADFESGFASDPDGVAANVRMCVDTGVAGLSIEDSTGDPDAPLYDMPLAVERLNAARSAIDDSGTGVLLTARAENFFVGVRDLDDVVRRVEAYAAAGADVIYAPGIRGVEQITAVVQTAAPLPVNVLALPRRGMNVAGYAALGVRRISLGSILARTAWAAFAATASAIAEDGSLGAIDSSVEAPDLNALFRR